MENQQASAVAEAEETTLSVLEEYASLESTGSITAHHRALLRRHAATGTKECVRVLYKLVAVHGGCL